MFEYLKIRDVKDPIRDVEENAGIDFFIPEKSVEMVEKLKAFNPAIEINDNQIVIPPHEDILIPSGLKTKFPKNVAFMANNKSGIATKNKLIFGAQLIDTGYQGECHIHLINFSNKTQYLEFGKKAIQFVPVLISNDEGKVYDALFTSEEEFFNKTTNRGASGFGSTGV